MLTTSSKELAVSTLRFCNLGSGSSGNATVVEGRQGGRIRRLLIDCGFGLRQLQQRLARAGLDCNDIDAVFITHEHSDHIGSAVLFAQRYRVPLWMSGGTHASIGSPTVDGLLRLVRDGDHIDLGNFEALAFTVPHDAREPLQLRCSDGARHLGIATDLGHATPYVLAQLAQCDALLLEANHDPELLARSAYPAFLQRRIAGTHGHLPNQTTVEILNAVKHPRLTQVVAAHLSERNNHPDIVRPLLSEALGWPMDQLVIADPKSGTPWLRVGE